MRAQRRMATIRTILFTLLMKKLSSMSVRVCLAASKEDSSNGSLIKQEFILLT